MNRPNHHPRLLQVVQLTIIALASACADSNVGSKTSEVDSRDAAPDAADSAFPSPEDAFTLADTFHPPVGGAESDARAPDAASGPEDAIVPPPADGPAAQTDAGSDAEADAAAPLPDLGPDAAACVPAEEICNGVDDDCDAEVDEQLPLYWPDADGDGFGGPVGPPRCEPEEGRVADGGDCDDENPDINPDASDEPDPAFVDSNCDHIDGTRRNLLFVDAAANPQNQDGTPEHAFSTIAQAIAEAAGRPAITGIAVGAGRYEERVSMLDGVSLYGGYDPRESWSRSARLESLIAHSASDRGRIVAVIAEAIRLPTYLDLMSVEASGDPGPGGSLYAIYARGAPGLILRAVTARSGAGPAGIAGADGAVGENGQPGHDGGACGQAPGAGGPSACGATGGAGGTGSPQGNDGAPGEFPGCGGAGGPRGGGGAGGDGAHGCNPAAPGAGADGSGASDGQVDPQGYWMTASGANGDVGPNGPPGGGGGGGGGAAVIGGTGGAGAGGGAGGCGGRPGVGGSGGGGSFALFVVDSTGIRIETSEFESGDGGAGASGGAGGPPGQGAPGGRGGSGREAFACGGLAGPGAGGNGGQGANGGRGGHGGGGAGGPTVAVYCANTQAAIGADTFLRFGVPGAGGASSALPGQAGMGAASVGCQ